MYERAKDVKVREYALEDSWTALAYLGILDQVRDFRNRHWSLTKEYILKHTKYPRATGGSPIVTWLPNQLTAVMSQIGVVAKKVDTSKLDAEGKDKEKLIRIRAEA